MQIEASPIVGRRQRQETDDGSSHAPSATLPDVSSGGLSNDMSQDTLAVMFRMEQHYMPTSCLPYPSVVGRDATLPIPNAEWRSKICDWSYRVVDHFRYDREVVSISMNMFDRFLVLSKLQKEAAEAAGKKDELAGMKDLSCSPKSCPSSDSSRYTDPESPEEDPDSRNYQLAAMTALYLSIKLHAENGLDGAQDEDPASSSKSPGANANGTASSRKTSQKSPNVRRKKRRIKLMSFVELSRGQFRYEDIASMEKTILDTLNWRLNPPTPTAFVPYLLKCLPAGGIHHSALVLHVLHELSRYLTELSVCLADASTLYQPSAVAYAAVLISMDTIHTDALPVSARSAFIAAVTRLSAEGGGMLLTPHCEAVSYLMGRIQTSFLPEMLLDAASCPPQGLDGETHGHPIAIARDAGLLNMNSLRGFDTTLEPSDDEADTNDEMCHRRGYSASSVMEDLVSSPRMTVSKDSWDEQSPSGIDDEKIFSDVTAIKTTDHIHHNVCHRIEEDVI